MISSTLQPRDKSLQGWTVPKIIGPTARALADAAPATVGAVRDAVRDAVTPYFRDGVLRLGSATWVASARPRRS